MSPNNKDDNAVEDSYVVAQSSKVLTLRCAEDINVLLSNVSLNKSQPIASSNSTIRLIIKRILYDVLSQIFDEIKIFPNVVSSIKIEGSRDVENLAPRVIHIDCTKVIFFVSKRLETKMSKRDIYLKMC